VRDSTNCYYGSHAGTQTRCLKHKSQSLVSQSGGFSNFGYQWLHLIWRDWRSIPKFHEMAHGAMYNKRTFFPRSEILIGPGNGYGLPAKLSNWAFTCELCVGEGIQEAVDEYSIYN
jgi:hypothetical protein